MALSDLCGLRDQAKIREFFKFAVELRKYDKYDEYTDAILQPWLRPPVLVDIIKANRWNLRTSTMEVDPKEGLYHIETAAGDRIVYEGDGAALRIRHVSKLQQNEECTFQFVLTESGFQV